MISIGSPKARAAPCNEGRTGFAFNQTLAGVTTKSIVTRRLPLAESKRRRRRYDFGEHRRKPLCLLARHLLIEADRI